MDYLIYNTDSPSIRVVKHSIKDAKEYAKIWSMKSHGSEIRIQGTGYSFKRGEEYLDAVGLEFLTLRRK